MLELTGTIVSSGRITVTEMCQRSTFPELFRGFPAFFEYPHDLKRFFKRDEGGGCSAEEITAVIVPFKRWYIGIFSSSAEQIFRIFPGANADYFQPDQWTALELLPPSSG